MSKYGICLQACITMRHEAKHQSEMTNQLIFGDIYEIIDENKDWTNIKSIADNYVSWIDSKNIEKISEEDANNYITAEKHISSDLFSFVKFTNSKKEIIIPIGSYITKNHLFSNKLLNYSHSNNCIQKSEFNIPNMLEHAHKLLETPYLWGGKTPMGMDCSGFTQVLYRFAGFQLPRDASQQAKIGYEVSLDYSQMGDLAFFEENSKINHVGILISNDKIIHCSGKVRIDKIDTQGIYNESIKKYTHSLKTIKRLELITQ